MGNTRLRICVPQPHFVDVLLSYPLTNTDDDDNNNNSVFGVRFFKHTGKRFTKIIFALL